MGEGLTSYPTGIVTLLFSDIEKSCRKWDDFGEQFEPLLQKHNRIFRHQIALHHGYEVSTGGDAFMVAFESAREALHCAVEIQRALWAEPWEPLGSALRVRIGLHTGEPIGATGENGKRDYLGPVTNRAARIMQCAHGGQLVMSEITRSAARTIPPGVTLLDLREHRLKGLGEPEHLWQVNYDQDHTSFPPLETLNSIKHNLPLLLTSVVGRDREVQKIKSMLLAPPGKRWVTLHGIGGSGKTLLAQLVAAEVAVPQAGETPHFRDGVWFIDLTTAVEMDQVWQAMARALTVQPQPAGRLKDDVLNVLSTKNLLLILDNCEQLKSVGLPQEITRLLRACPDVTCIATSQKILMGVVPEAVYPVKPLKVPREGSAAALMKCESVALFAERAKRVDPEFEITPENTCFLIHIVQRLDGLPMAIELAAARASMGLPQLLECLNELPPILSEQANHGHMDHVIGWAFGSLTEQEKRLLLRLSVFTGGFFAKAAEEVCGSASQEPGKQPARVGFMLDDLRKNSLLSGRQVGAEVRFTMLEVLRSFCAKQLIGQEVDGKHVPPIIPPEQMETLHRRHAAYFLAIARALKDNLHRERDAWRAMERELPNIRAAMDWALKAKEDALAAQIALELCPFFAFRGYSTERLERCQAGLDAAERAAAAGVAASLLHQLGWCHFDRSERQSAKRRLLEAVAARRQLLETLGDTADERERKEHARWLGMSENTLSQCLRFGGSLPEAKLHAQQARKMMLTSGDARGMGLVMNNIGLMAKNEGNYDEAQNAFEEALRYSTDANDLSCQAQVQNSLGLLYERQGNFEQAEHSYTQAVKRLRMLGRLRDVASCLSNLARLALRSGRLDKAEKRETRALRIRREVNDLNGICVSLVQLSTIRLEQARVDGLPPHARKKLLDDAKRKAEESLQIWTKIEHKNKWQGLVQLGDVLMERGELEAAAKYYLEANTIVADREKYEDEVRAEVLLSWAKCGARLGEEQSAINRYHDAHFWLWRSPTIQKYRMGTARDPSPPKEIRHLEEVLQGLSRLREKQGDARRAGWCLHVAARFAESHPGVSSEILTAYAAFQAAHEDLAALYKRWDARIRNQPAPPSAPQPTRRGTESSPLRPLPAE